MYFSPLTASKVLWLSLILNYKIIIYSSVEFSLCFLMLSLFHFFDLRFYSLHQIQNISGYYFFKNFFMLVDIVPQLNEALFKGLDFFSAPS